MNLKFLMSFLVALTLSALFVSCGKEESLTTTSEEINLASNLDYFSADEIASISEWMLKQEKGELNLTDFPAVSYEAGDVLNADKVKLYMNGIMYNNDDIMSGDKENHDFMIDQINNDVDLDQAGKDLLLSVVQLSAEVFTTRAAMEFYFAADEAGERDPCGCDNIWASYVTLSIQCQAYGDWWGHCTAASNTYSQWVACTNQTITCPNGFTYDGANCYSGVHFPSGYNGFIWGNGFYTQRNCSISWANNCCPNGFGYDGANCHYWGLYFPSSYTPFIWNNTFYVKAKCL